MPNSEKKEKPEKKPKVMKNIVKICIKHDFQPDEVKNIAEGLLQWYDLEQRKLPWRDIAKSEIDTNIRGYAVWVSEIMLQQTQVATVIPYFNKWIKKWPTVKHLASAELEEVLQLWSGLGYYSRGRRLHEGAKIIMDKLNGIIPSTVAELTKQIPGIGTYSASAISSVAFQNAVGVVDGNVIRVLSRMRAIGANISQPGVRDHLWKLANEMVSRERPGDYNQALMELGATVCTPQNPNCAKCPVNTCCSAYSVVEKSLNKRSLHTIVNKKSIKVKEKQEDIPDIENVIDCDFCLPKSQWEKNPQVTVFPCKVEKKKAREETVNVIVIQNDKEFLIVKRPEKGLLAGLWEFPSVIFAEDSSKKINSSKLNGLLKELGLPVSLLSTKQHIGDVVHLFSHIHTTYVVDHINVHNSHDLVSLKKEAKWVSEEELKNEAISTAMKKVFAVTKKLKESENKIPNKKRKLSVDDSKQKSIKSFFHKC